MRNSFACTLTRLSVTPVTALILSMIPATLPSKAQTPVSGIPVRELSGLDTIVESLMTRYHSPGASLAVSVDGRLVYARGYGYADVSLKQFVQPDSLFRVASNSKALTATAILKLIEDGKLSLSTRPFDGILAALKPLPGETEDPRIGQITIKELLEHTAGWDDTKQGVPDPAFAYEVTAAEAFGAAPPATPEELIRFMLGKRLQHNPGTVYAYSNFGYIVLGEVIAQITRDNYTSYVSGSILPLAGLVRMQPGGSLLSERKETEVAYYDYPGAPLASSVFDPAGPEVPEPYGGFSLALMAANGGWISSSIDLVRFADTMNGQLSRSILKSPPEGFPGYVPPFGQYYDWYFYGSLPGTNSLLHLDTTGEFSGEVTWAAIFNTRWSVTDQPQTDADTEIGEFLEGVKQWPQNNLFSIYDGPDSSCRFSLSASKQSFPSTGGKSGVAVTDENDCAWSAVSNASWLHVTSGALNSQAKTVSFTVDKNTSTKARTGELTIAGQTFTVEESGT